jgi:glucose/arabinose dehydrogenase
MNATSANPAAARHVRAVAAAIAFGIVPFADATPLTTVRVAAGLAQPLCIAHAPGVGAHLFVLERTGRIRVVDLATPQVLPTPFLDVSALVATNWLEYGLLGIAFHPDYESNGYFYINYTPPVGTVADTAVVRYRVSAGNPLVADPASASLVLRFGYGTRLQHRAGWMDFGPDGFLYVATGDGAENDPDNAAQSVTTLRGKILRLDVNGPDGQPGTADDDQFPADANRNYRIPAGNPFAGSATNAQEIWAYGLRNPWRCSFDRETGDLWIADVGQAAREEINFQPAAAGDARNYGWRCTEGTFCTGLSGCTCNGPTLTPPIFEYTHAIGVSVTGGYVYRGCAIPDFRGVYFFAEYQFSKVFSMRYNGTVSEFTERTAELAPGGGLTLQTVASLGEDLAGELYLCDYNGGEVFKIVPRSAPPASLAITLQPIGASACLEQSATFTVAATSIGSPASYRWRRGGVDLVDDARISGSATATLGIANIRASDAASYDCVVSNACASLTSDAASLGVCVGDVNCNGAVDLADLSTLLAHFGTLSGATAADGDLDGNDTVDLADLAVLLSRFGATCP